MKKTYSSFISYLFPILLVFVIAGCEKKTESGNGCRTCTATYSTGSIAGGPTEVCSDEAETSFRNLYNYAHKIECK